MTKKLLIKVIGGKASPEEERIVLDWVNQNERNLYYFVELKELWIVQHLPVERAGLDYLSKLRSIVEGEKRKEEGGKRELVVGKWVLYAAAIVLLLAIPVGLNLFTNHLGGKSEQSPRIVLSEYPAEYKHTIYTNKGVKAYTQLPDGSQVWLNSDSKITFPDTFLGPTREVIFSGEAFFEVVKDSLRPMIITTNRNFEVKVLGTKFNVKTNDNDSEARVTLLSGTVEVITSKKVAGKIQKSSIVLSNQQSYIVSDDKPATFVSVSDTLKQTAWKNGKLFFDYTPLEEVIKQLERWHGVEFLVEDNAAYNIKFTAEFEQESIVQILEMLKFCSRIDYRMLDRRTVVIGMKK